MFYAMEVATPEEIHGDPFGGGGVWLPLPGASGETILATLEDRFGAIVPAVASPGLGAWVDLRGAVRDERGPLPGKDLADTWVRLNELEEELRHAQETA